MHERRVHETVNFIVSRNDAVVYRVRRHRLDAGSDGGMTDSLERTTSQDETVDRHRLGQKKLIHLASLYGPVCDTVHE